MDQQQTGFGSFRTAGAGVRGAQAHWHGRMREAGPVQKVLGGIIALFLLGLLVIVTVVSLAVGVVAALVAAVFILARRAVHAVTGGGRDALNKARGQDSDGRRNVTVVRR